MLACAMFRTVACRCGWYCVSIFHPVLCCKGRILLGFVLVTLGVFKQAVLTLKTGPFMKRLSIHNANHVEFSCILLDANSCKGLGGRQCVVSE
jgi:hypothetical protein